MKKILFSLVALVCSMSMNAQVMKIMKNGEEVATYKGAEYTVVFEEEKQPVQKFIYMNVENGDFSLSTDKKTLTATKDGVTLTATITTSGNYVFGLDDFGEGYMILDPKWGTEAEDLVSVQVAVSGAISYDRIFVLNKDLIDTGTTGPWTFIWNNDQGGFKLEGASGWGVNLFRQVDIRCWM